MLASLWLRRLHSLIPLPIMLFLPSGPSLSHGRPSPFTPFCWDRPFLSTLSKIPPPPSLSVSLSYHICHCTVVFLLPVLPTVMQASRRQTCICFVYCCIPSAGALWICRMNRWMNSEPFKTWEWKDQVCVLGWSLWLQCGVYKGVDLG